MSVPQVRLMNLLSGEKLGPAAVVGLWIYLEIQIN